MSGVMLNSSSKLLRMILKTIYNNGRSGGEIYCSGGEKGLNFDLESGFGQTECDLGQA
jgi:hypothetical protein